MRDYLAAIAARLYFERHADCPGPVARSAVLAALADAGLWKVLTLGRSYR